MESGITESSGGTRRTRGLGKKTLEKYVEMDKDPQLSVLKQKTESIQHLVCKCKNSKCLKMYCECFTAGRFCDGNCNCLGCMNTE